MKILPLFQILVAAAIAAPVPITAPPASPAPPARAKLSVVATTPDLASLAREIGGDAVDVKALAKPTEDPHFVDAKPSHIVTLNRADVLIDGGAELELGWLPALLESARNDKIAAGSPGRISASAGVQMMEVPSTFDRAKGDVHSLGNPHFLVDPVRVKLVIAQITEHLSLVDPQSAPMFAANRKKFEAALDLKLAEWQKLLAPYKGAKIATYHKDFVYLAERFGLNIVEELEPKPGIAPSPAHLAKVIGTMKSNNVKVILVQPFQNRKTAETVARQTDATVLDMPEQPGATKNTDSYIAMMDNLVGTLAKALGGAK
ncbi:MAG: metal ABC transporter substrate-binding protein [Gemmatimonadetes bacterium]|nr:metal ABC transporter substrate-binding protein [Gemmatimonadota bacterium]